MRNILELPGHLIRRLHQISVSVFADRIRGLDLDLTSPQFAALATLGNHPGIDQATLAGLIACDRPTTGGIIERLEVKGYVARQKNEQDRRAKLLFLTQDGSAVLGRVWPEIVSIQEDTLVGLTPQERKTFVRLATKVALAGNAQARVAQSMLKG